MHVATAIAACLPANANWTWGCGLRADHHGTLCWGITYRRGQRYRSLPQQQGHHDADARPRVQAPLIAQLRRRHPVREPDVCAVKVNPTDFSACSSIMTHNLPSVRRYRGMIIIPLHVNQLHCYHNNLRIITNVVCHYGVTVGVIIADVKLRV
jgi:hypothetical protein